MNTIKKPIIQEDFFYFTCSILLFSFAGFLTFGIDIESWENYFPFKVLIVGALTCGLFVYILDNKYLRKYVYSFKENVHDHKNNIIYQRYYLNSHNSVSFYKGKLHCSKSYAVDIISENIRECYLEGEKIDKSQVNKLQYLYQNMKKVSTF